MWGPITIRGPKLDPKLRSYTVAQVADALQVSPNVVRSLIKAGRLPGAFRTWTTTGRWVIPAAAVKALLSSDLRVVNVLRR